jgi:uncharacterized protein involved in response to NO
LRFFHRSCFSDHCAAQLISNLLDAPPLPPYSINETSFVRKMKGSRAKKIIHGYYAEPFRIFFPAGILLGIAGVALWPAYYGGLTITYPGTAHARLMIEGFMASFIIGFLGTAGPRITSTASFSPNEVVSLLTLDLLAAGLHFSDAHRAGDALFVVCLVFFVFSVGKRFLRRKDIPPPNFAIVALGLLNGLAGAILVALFEDKVYSAAYRIGAAFLEQGFVLFPILGVAPFLLPRLLGGPQPDDLPESPRLPPGWIARAAFAIVIGLIIDGTFVADVFGAAAIAGWVRLAAILIYLAARMPWTGQSFLGNSLRAGIAAIPLGIAMELLWPQYRTGALHLVFISGFGFIVLTVGIRVVFGHAGRRDLLHKPLPFFIMTSTLISLAALSRYGAELAPKARTMHLVAAAVCWIIAALIWVVRVIPKVTIFEPEE